MLAIGCIYWCPKVFCRMRSGGRVNLRLARFQSICLLGWISVRKTVGGKSLTMWGAEGRVWAATVIRFNGGILRDIHTHFFYDIPRSVSVEIQVDGHLPREALSALRTMMKVPPRIIMLDEPLNIDAQKSWDPGGKNRASCRRVRVNGRVGGDFTVLKSSYISRHFASWKKMVPNRHWPEG